MNFKTHLRYRSLFALTLLALGVCNAVGAEIRGKIIPDWPEPKERMPNLYIPLYNNTNPDLPLPQDALLIPTREGIAEAREDMQVAMVVADMGLGNDNPIWRMSQTALSVFLNRLATLDEKPVREDIIWPYLDDPDPRYKGLSVILQTKTGKRFSPLSVYRGKMLLNDGTLVARDSGRRLEYWLFGTARVRRDQLVGSRVLPVFTFNQCRSLGQRVVETTPRQCLLADNNLMLETAEQPTLASARLRTFEECLRKGSGLIYTFPRRCLSGGGRVFTEPPQVYESATPRDAPLKTPKIKPLAPTPSKAEAAAIPQSLLPLTLSPTIKPVSPTGLVKPVSATAPAKPVWADLGGKK